MIAGTPAAGVTATNTGLAETMSAAVVVITIDLIVAIEPLGETVVSAVPTEIESETARTIETEEQTRQVVLPAATVMEREMLRGLAGRGGILLAVVETRCQAVGTWPP